MVGHAGVGVGHAGWVGHVGVGSVMQRWGGSCRGGVGYVGVRVCHTGVEWGHI